MSRLHTIRFVGAGVLVALAACHEVRPAVTPQISGPQLAQVCPDQTRGAAFARRAVADTPDCVLPATEQPAVRRDGPAHIGDIETSIDPMSLFDIP